MPFRDSPISFFAPICPVAKCRRTLYVDSPSQNRRWHSLSSTVVDIPRSQAPSSIERWYVLILMCLIYAINIADRYVVSTVLEPIRLELKLDDAGVAFLTAAPLVTFYVTFGILISWVADRSNRRNILAISLIIWSGFTALCGLSRNYMQ